MPAAEAFQLEIHTDTQHLPLLAAARVLFFHGKNVIYLYIHWNHFLYLFPSKQGIGIVKSALKGTRSARQCLVWSR